jgi:hypothetical protein
MLDVLNKVPPPKQKPPVLKLTARSTFKTPSTSTNSNPQACRQPTLEPTLSAPSSSPSAISNATGINARLCSASSSMASERYVFGRAPSTGVSPDSVFVPLSSAWASGRWKFLLIRTQPNSCFATLLCFVWGADLGGGTSRSAAQWNKVQSV